MTELDELTAAETALAPLERALYELMSYVSEDCYCAGWMDGTEYAIWDLCREARPTWGQGPSIDAKSILTSIRTLANLIERWIVWDHGPQAVTLVQFQVLYNARATAR